MNKQFLIGLIFILGLIFSFQQEGDLVKLIEVFRHGARDPVYSEINDKIVSADYKLPADGELSLAGQRMHYLLGSLLKEEYIDQKKFIDANYNYSQVHVQSTDVNRTYMSVQSQLLGLFDLGTGQSLPNSKTETIQRAKPPYIKTWAEAQQILTDKGMTYQEAIEKKYQPIPVHSTHYADDTLCSTYSAIPCPVNNILNELKKTSEIHNKIYGEYFDKCQTIATRLDAPEIKDLYDCAKMWDVYQDYLYYYGPAQLPSVFPNYAVFHEPDVAKLFEEVYMINLLDNVGGSELQRWLTRTPFFNLLTEQFDEVVNGKQQFKWNIYSAHDTTVAMFLIALNQTSCECVYERVVENRTLGSWDKCKIETVPFKIVYKYPNFTSNIILELYKKKGATTSTEDDYFVKLKYEGQYMPICNRMESAEPSCSYKEFRERINFNLIPNFDQFCKFDSTDQLKRFLLSGQMAKKA